MSQSLFARNIHEANAILSSLSIGMSVFVGSSQYIVVNGLDGKALKRQGAVIPASNAGPEPFVKTGTLHGKATYGRMQGKASNAR
jgi:hypothetical protein